MIHLSFLLLHLQYCWLFIFFIFIIIIYHLYLSLLYFHHHLYSSFHSFIISFSLLLLLIIPFYFILITTQNQYSQCGISFQWFTYHSCSWFSNIALCSYYSFYHYPFFISLSLKFSLSFIFFHSFVFFITTQIQHSQCSIGFQWFTYHSCPKWSNRVSCLYYSFLSFIISISHYPILFSNRSLILS